MSLGSSYYAPLWLVILTEVRDIGFWMNIRLLFIELLYDNYTNDNKKLKSGITHPVINNLNIKKINIRSYNTNRNSYFDDILKEFRFGWRIFNVYWTILKIIS